MHALSVIIARDALPSLGVGRHVIAYVFRELGRAIFAKALPRDRLLLRVGEWPEAQAVQSSEPLLIDTSPNYFAFSDGRFKCVTFEEPCFIVCLIEVYCKQYKTCLLTMIHLLKI